MKRLLDIDTPDDIANHTTDFERWLLTSTDLDIAPEGAASRLLDHLELAAPVVPIEEARRKRPYSTAVFLLAACLGAAILILDRSRHPRVPISSDLPHVDAPTHVPTPVSSDAPATEMPLPREAPSQAPTPVAIPASPPAPRRAIEKRVTESASATPTPTPTLTPTPTQTPIPATDPSFDKGAAARALSQVDVSACALPDGPTGQGHVMVVFEPSGGVSSAVVDDTIFPGTAVGGCVAAKFRGARVPPFTGAPVRVGKMFLIK